MRHHPGFSLRSALLAGVLSAALCAVSAAQTVLLGASMDGVEEGVASSGSGSALLTLDTATGGVMITGTYTGLGSNQTFAHIHGAAPRGMTAGIVLTLNGTGGTTGSFSGSGVLSPAQMTDLLNGLHYVNIHTSNFPLGEIRGQLDLVPTVDCPSALPNDPVLSDCAGTSFLGPNINDALEGFGVQLDCTGAPSSGPYVVLIRQNKLGSPLSTGYGDLWASGVTFSKFSGIQNQNVVGVHCGGLTLPNDMSLVGLSYAVQGWCGGRLSNAFQETIGLP